MSLTSIARRISQETVPKATVVVRGTAVVVRAAVEAADAGVMVAAVAEADVAADAEIIAAEDGKRDFTPCRRNRDKGVGQPPVNLFATDERGLMHMI